MFVSFSVISDMIVGFGGTEYSVAGDDDSVSVCVMVTNPPFGGALRPFTIAIHPVEGKTSKKCVLPNMYLLCPSKTDCCVYM